MVRRRIFRRAEKKIKKYLEDNGTALEAGSFRGLFDHIKEKHRKTIGKDSKKIEDYMTEIRKAMRPIVDHCRDKCTGDRRRVASVYMALGMYDLFFSAFGESEYMDALLNGAKNFRDMVAKYNSRNADQPITGPEKVLEEARMCLSKYKEVA